MDFEHFVGYFSRRRTKNGRQKKKRIMLPQAG